MLCYTDGDGVRTPPAPKRRRGGGAGPERAPPKNLKTDGANSFLKDLVYKQTLAKNTYNEQIPTQQITFDGPPGARGSPPRK